MREQLIGGRALRTKISLANRTFRVAFDGNQFPILMINQLSASDAAVRTNRACDLCIIDTRMHRACRVRHRLKTGAVLAPANLPNERPFRKQREHDLYLFLRYWIGLQWFESVVVELAKQKQTQLDNHTDCSRRGGLTMIGSKMETSITTAIT